ncbi:hypothetical protein LCGC14_3013100, partial [marine sediment metagenome]
CQYDNKHYCHLTFINKCAYESIISCLKAQVNDDRKRLAKLNYEIERGHTRLSIKWKDQSFYYKAKVKALEAYITDKGLDVPTVVELRKGGTDDD